MISSFTHATLVALCNNTKPAACPCVRRLVEWGGYFVLVNPRLPLQRVEVLWCPACALVLEILPRECRLAQVYPMASAVLPRRRRKEAP